MTRKTALIFIFLFFALVFGGLVYSYFAFMPGREGEVKSEEKKSMGFRSFFPFAEDNLGGEDIDGVSPVITDSEGRVVMPSLRRISSEPIAGFTSYSTTTGTSTPNKNVFRFVVRATGHIYDVAEDSLEVVRVSNTTIPKVTEAHFLSNEKVLARFIKEDNETIETFLGQLKKDDLGNYTSLDGIYLPSDISEVAISPLGNIFYLQENETGSFGIILNTTTNRSERVFESPLKELRFEWPSESRIIYFTKPSATVPGYLFSLNVSTGATAKVLGGMRALSAIGTTSPSHVLYSENSGDKISLRGADLTSQSFGNKGLSTLADKCVWPGALIYCAVPKSSISGNLPDAWYQGRVSFTDNIWEIEGTSDTARFLADLSELSREDIDAINLQTTKDGKYLLFINKRDGSLWSLRLSDLDPDTEQFQN